MDENVNKFFFEGLILNLDFLREIYINKKITIRSIRSSSSVIVKNKISEIK